MKKQFRLIATALVALVAVLAGTSAAQAYPKATFSFSLSKHTVIGGGSFVATASANVSCSNWTLTFLGQSASGSGKKISHTFTTPVVSAQETRKVRAQCTYTLTGGASGTAVRVIDSKSPVLTSEVIILPRTGAGSGSGNGSGQTSSSAGSGLPNTGGPAFWILIVALLLILAGLVTVIRNRRRADPDEPAVPPTAP